LLGCGKKTEHDAPSATAAGSSDGSAKPHAIGGSGEGADTPPPGVGLTVAHSVGEFSGTYDKAFGKLANGDEPTTIAFLRGCSAASCADNVFEIESLAAKCPKGYLALAKLRGEEPRAGHRRADVVFAGPAEKSSTVTIEKVKLEITDMGPDGIAGSASQKSEDTSVTGTFKAEICPRT
ncbi:MAG: hypothetical protein ABI678_22815, partial [Kofleriaceae bacterium]